MLRPPVSVHSRRPRPARTVVEASGHALRTAARVILALALCLGVSGVQAVVHRKPTPPAPVPPSMRLGDAVKPLAYDAELTIVPTSDRFTGHLVIHADLARTTDFFWINATRLDIRQASVTTVAVPGGKPAIARTVPGGRDFVGLRFAAPVPAGRIVITIDYDGVIDRLDTAGIFRLQDGDQWYAYTQFEATDARRAFPCFDEPGWKTPWHLSLIVPAADVAVSNMPTSSEEPVAAAAAAPEPPPKKGAPAPVSAPAVAMKRVRFAPTPPLPSYLVAFAVGPFDVVDGGRAGRKGTPLRYVVPKGRAGETAYARETTPRILEQLEDYFGQPFPFPKLDSVALPVTRDFGAMENAGMITYQASLMTARPEQETERFRRGWAATAAHEMAHQWFGDLVTMQWWNDLWLNESFATWMSRKVVERAFPTWLTKLSGDDARVEAIHVDRLASARQVRQAVNTPDDLGNVFDSITYAKGASVLAMVETAVGEERFRNGVRRYLSEHAQGSARAEDFYAALSVEAGPENATVVGGMRGFIEQPGVPRVAVSLDCGIDGKAAPKLVLNQTRFLPSRPIGDPAFNQKWTFPACFQFGRGGDFSELCTVIQEARSVVALPAGESCPAWVLPNKGGSGYFVSSLTAELDAQLVRTPLLASEAIPALNDAGILVATGEWPADLGLDFAARFAGNRQETVIEAATRLAAGVRPSWLDAGEDRDGLARYVQKTFAPKARLLGWTAKATDRDGDPALRDLLLPFVADVGNDVTLQREATRLAREWVAARTPFPAGARGVLRTAARFAQGDAGRELVNLFVDALGRTGGADRSALQSALGSFRDPAIAEAAWDALFADKADIRDAVAALDRGPPADEVAAGAAVRFLRTHYDAIVRRLPENSAGFLPLVGARLCDAGARADFEATFAERAGKAPGGARNYAETNEEIGICLAARQLQRATLKAYVAKQ